VGYRKTAFLGTALNGDIMNKLRDVIKLDTRVTEARKQIADILDDKPLLRSSAVHVGCGKSYFWAEHWMSQHGGHRFDPERDYGRRQRTRADFFGLPPPLSAASSRGSSRRVSRRNSSEEYDDEPRDGARALS
jgi:hypothetical protein